MDWNISWIVWSVISFSFVIINLIRLAYGKIKGCTYLVFGSFSLGLFAVYNELKIINQWILHGEIALMSENVASIQTVFFWVIIGIIILNLLAVIMLSKLVTREKRMSSI
ncbi:MAG: hypothetical protein ACRC9L_04260 [Brevinema sp.]